MNTPSLATELSPASPSLSRATRHVRDLLSLILPSALVVATLDGLFAVLVYVVVLDRYSVVGALQYIASGLIGERAFAGGLTTAALGAAMHVTLSFAFAALYALAARAVPRVRRSRGVALGLAYGAGIWLVMGAVVLPLTGVPQGDDAAWVFWAFLADHALFVGLPIVVLVHARLRRADDDHR